MTRIISGFAGSLTIAVPDAGTRPTSDRVREAIFSALDARGVIAGSSVVDLYAGSGAVGLEAASRGAARVVLVEKSARASAVCRRNAALVRAAAPDVIIVEVVGKPVQSYLSAARGRFDFAFVDPPYDLAEEALAGDLSALAELLTDDATVVVERSSRSPQPTWPAALELDRRRAYGDTTLWWASRRTRAH